MPAESGERPSNRLRDDQGGAVVPVTDIVETDVAFVIIADMPGVAPDRLEITAERDSLIIRGRVTRSTQPPHHREFALVDYAQRFTLTEDLDPARIRAALKDGVLRLTVPKSETVQPRRIPIQSE